MNFEPNVVINFYLPPKLHKSKEIKQNYRKNGHNIFK